MAPTPAANAKQSPSPGQPPAQGWGSIKHNLALLSSHQGSIGVGAAPNKPQEVHRTQGPPTPPVVVPGAYSQLVIVRDHDGTEFRLKDIDLAVDTVGRVKTLLARAMRCLPDHVVFLPSSADSDTLVAAGVKPGTQQLSVRQEGRPSMHTPLAPERGQVTVTPLPTYYPPTTEHFELEAFRQKQLEAIKAEAHAEVRRAKEVQIQTAVELDNVRREYQSLSRALECVPFMHESPYARSVDTRLVADNARAEAVREELQRSTLEFEAKKLTLDRRANELKREADALENQKRQMHLEDVRRHSALRSPGRAEMGMPSVESTYDAALDVSRQWHQSETMKERELQREIDVLQESLERRRRSRSPPKFINESPVRTQQQLYPLPTPSQSVCATERRGLRTPNSF